MSDNIFNGNGTDSGSGGGGGTPADYNQVKEQVEQNKSDIAAIKAEQTAQNESISDLKQSQLVQDNAIAKNSGNIEFISSAINRLHGDYLDYEPISGGVCLVDNAAKPIQTGYRMNGDYDFIVKGHTTTAGKGCLIGAYQANNARTTMQLFGKSGKLQGQWAANRELTKEQAIALGLPENYITTPQTYKINKDGVFIKQGEDWLQLVENSGYTGTGNNPFIYLLGDQESDHTEHYGVLYYAEILDTDGNTAATFIPAKNKNTGEIVILKTNKTSSFVLRPVLGSLKEFVNQ